MISELNIYFVSYILLQTKYLPVAGPDGDQDEAETHTNLPTAAEKLIIYGTKSNTDIIKAAIIILILYFCTFLAIKCHFITASPTHQHRQLSSTETETQLRRRAVSHQLPSPPQQVTTGTINLVTKIKGN